MKVKANKTEEFKPVSIEIIFETQEELDNFGALFNYVPFDNVCKMLSIDCESVRSACSDVGGTTMIRDNIRAAWGESGKQG